jgi:putative colanic acid biosynthesis UDP-glucose lipid carrier transferase
LVVSHSPIAEVSAVPLESYAAATSSLDTATKRLRKRNGGVGALSQLIDQLIIMCSLMLAVGYGGGDWLLATIGGIAAIIAFSFFGKGRQLYRSWPTGSVPAQMLGVLEAWLSVLGLALLFMYLQQKKVAYPREAILAWLLITPAVLCGWRLSMAYTLRRASGIRKRRLAIVGRGEFARHLQDLIDGNAWTRFQTVGVFDDLSSKESVDGNAKPGERSLSALVDLARSGGVDVIYITLPAGAWEPSIGKLLEQLSNSTISAYLVQDRRSTSHGFGMLRRLPWLHRWHLDIGGIQAVSIYESPFLSLEGWVKRLEDVVISSLALILLALPMVLIAIGVKLSGPGPIIFKQRRYGLDGRCIVVWKFRSMTTCEDGDHIDQATKADPRVTRFGAFIRRTSLDELPQFFNVLQGRMSVVGPRPHAVAHNEHYRHLVGGYMLRHKVKPGITGWAQVNGLRGETKTPDDMRRRIEFDLAYIRNWSLWLDLRIICMTPVCGLVHKNAY